MSLSSDVSNFRRTATVTLAKQRKEIILRLFRSVIYDTPVDTGMLRGNWRCSSVEAHEGVLAYRPANQVLAEIEAVIDNSLLESTIFFRNNLPYAYRIEYLGWSRIKAPQGMVRKNVVRFEQIARSVTGA